MDKKLLIRNICIVAAALVVLCILAVGLWFLGTLVKDESHVSAETVSVNSIMRKYGREIESGSLRIEAEDAAEMSAALYGYAASNTLKASVPAISIETGKTDVFLYALVDLDKLDIQGVNLSGERQIKLRLRLSAKAGYLRIGVVRVDIGISPVPAAVARPLIQAVADSMGVEYVDGYLEIPCPEFKVAGFGKVRLKQITNQSGTLYIGYSVDAEE